MVECRHLFEIRDMLHIAGNIPAAQRAHDRAMPLLAEMSALLGQPSIRDVFGTVQRDNSERLLGHPPCPRSGDTVTAR